MKKSLLILIPAIILAAVLIVFVMFSIMNSAPRNLPSFLTENSSDGDDALSYKSIVTTFKNLSRNDRQKYVHTLVGERVTWMGQVEEVKGGRVYVQVGQRNLNKIRFFIYPIGQIQATDIIKFEAEINRISSFAGVVTMDLTNPKVLALTKAADFEANEMAALESTPTLSGSIASSPTPTLSPNQWVATANQQANLYLNPTIFSSRRTTVLSGQKLDVLGINNDGTWLCVLINNEPLWIQMSRVTMNVKIFSLPFVTTEMLQKYITATPTATIELTATITETPKPFILFPWIFRSTLTPSRTPTDIKPTKTPTPTFTPTPTRTSTPTNTPTKTFTPTLTATNTPTNTPTATDTSTPTDTPTRTPTPTDTPTPTETDVPPTSTHTDTPVPSPTDPTQEPTL